MEINGQTMTEDINIVKQNILKEMQKYHKGKGGKIQFAVPKQVT